MKQIQLSENAKRIKSNEIPSAQLKKVYEALLPNEKSSFVRYYLLEGTPIMFDSEPLAFEIVKDWISGQLKIHPKEIVLIGSAKSGYSLSPNKFGKIFSAESDLDFALISSEIFRKVKAEFELWVKGYQTFEVHPANETQKNYWEENLRVVPGTLQRGFIDTNKIPNRSDLYPINQSINNSLSKLTSMLCHPKSKYHVKKSTLRIYQTWAEFTNQIDLNFRNMTKRIP